MFGTKIFNNFENESFGNLNFLLHCTENLVKKGVYTIPVVLNRWSADRYRFTTILIYVILIYVKSPALANAKANADRSALAFLPVHNNLLQFYTLKRRYQFKIKTISKEY